ncbi:hypothetical protein BJX68DRAFT_226598 [Aspergillus pseudodeflectus]|uniref:Beta-glucosidase n=1 Tax=Aspergillus pseudodeflectus TaxID=176178 RepID=A0ABR4L5G5_9EURO
MLRLRAPYEARSGAFEVLFHAGSLEFSQEERDRQSAILKTVPLSIVEIYLDRPAVIAHLASYGSSADAFLDVVLGIYSAEGKLPFDLPSSMEAVRNSKTDVPWDTKDPLYRFGEGLAYSSPTPASP